MPNGGDPEACRRAAPHYEKIEELLVSFAQSTPWYTFRGITKCRNSSCGGAIRQTLVFCVPLRCAFIRG